MEFSIVDEVRQRPRPKLRGTCPLCGRETLAKCGSIKKWHWSHANMEHCDAWWENEGEWHRRWKSYFPESFREIVHFDQDTGEKHIADIKTDRHMVIELQHSPISESELLSREKFYKNMIWIVDAEKFQKNFKIYESPLPHPESYLLDKYCFFDRADIFYIRSEYRKGERNLVEIHSHKKISDEVMLQYRGHHFFRWKRPNEVWFKASAPVFFDFGSDELFWLCKYDEGDNFPDPDICLYRNNHRYSVRRIKKKILVDKNGGTLHN